MARDFLDRAGWRHPAQGTADPDVRRADGWHAGDPRSLRIMAVASASAMGPDVDACSGAAVVPRDFLAGRRYILRRLGRRRHAEQAGRAGVARGAAGALFAAVLGDVLAGSAAGGNGGAGSVAGATGARRAVPAGLAGPVLDRVRAGADQAAALCAAALSGDRHVDGRGAGTPRAVA